MTDYSGARRHPSGQSYQPGVGTPNQYELASLPPIHRLEVITLQAGDLLVATVKATITAQQAATMEARLKAKVPDGVTVIVASGQIELAAYRPQASP